LTPEGLPLHPFPGTFGCVAVAQQFAYTYCIVYSKADWVSFVTYAVDIRTFNVGKDFVYTIEQLEPSDYAAFLAEEQEE